MPTGLASRMKTKLARWIGLAVPRVSAHGVQVNLAANTTYNEVLRSETEVTRAIEALRWTHPVREKTWDLLKCVHFALERMPARETRILDAGCNDSPALELLYGAGYRNLFGCDFIDSNPPQVPGLDFHVGDLMQTPWPDQHFGVISCISVIEHGFDCERLLREMARLIRPGGYLLVSTDYAEPKLDTSDVERRLTYGMPWLIFSRREIEEFLRAADSFGFELVEPIRWDQEDLVVSCWGKRYTFIFLALQRRSDVPVTARGGCLSGGADAKDV